MPNLVQEKVAPDGEKFVVPAAKEIMGDFAFEGFIKAADVPPWQNKKMFDLNDVFLNIDDPMAAKKKSPPKKDKADKPVENAVKVDPQSDPSTRISVFGNRWRGTKEQEWKLYPDVGWVYIPCEDNDFKCNYAECFVTKKWFKTRNMCRLINKEDGGPNLYISSAVAREQFLQCAWSSYYTTEDDLISVRTNTNNMVKISNTYLKNSGKKLERCDHYGYENYIPGSCSKVIGSNKYKMVCAHAVEHTKLFSACQHCGKIGEGDYIPKRKDIDNRHYCEPCYMKVVKANLIGAHDAKNYPDAIYTPITVMGHELIDGLFCATNKKEKIQGYRLFGVELETEMDMSACKRDKLNRLDMALEMRAALGSDFVMIKEDGTLMMNGKYDGSPDNDPNQTGRHFAGFELVSAPADLAAHRARWFKIKDAPHFKHLRSWDTPTCGMHVHVSRDSLTLLQQGRMLRFVNATKNQKFIHKVAGRGSERFCRYIPKDFSDSLHPEKNISPEEQKARDRMRRVALNTCNDHTIEFRIFRGTVNPRHILRNIEFCDAVCDFSYPCTRSLTEFDDYKFFVNYVSENRKKWPLLAEWFAKQKMIALKAIGEGADPSKFTLRPDLVEEHEYTVKVELDEPAAKPAKPPKKKADLLIKPLANGDMPPEGDAEDEQDDPNYALKKKANQIIDEVLAKKKADDIAAAKKKPKKPVKKLGLEADLVMVDDIF